MERPAGHEPDLIQAGCEEAVAEIAKDVPT
jgi:hypothetical protein